MTAYLETLDGHTENVTLDITPLRSWDRLKRAIKSFGLFGTFAFLSAFIPMVHFVLVPTFLVLATVSAFRRWSLVLDIKGQSVCPVCKHPLFLSGLSPDKKSHEFCTACRHQFKVVFSQPRL